MRSDKKNERRGADDLDAADGGERKARIADDDTVKHEAVWETLDEIKSENAPQQADKKNFGAISLRVVEILFIPKTLIVF